MKRAFISLVAVAALSAAPLSAIAADTKGPLAPGAAAGVKQAQGFDDVPLVFIVGGAVVVTAAVLALTNNDDNGTPPVVPPPVTTTTTTTTP